MVTVEDARWYRAMMAGREAYGRVNRGGYALIHPQSRGLRSGWEFHATAHLPVTPFMDSYLAIIDNAVFAIRKELWNGRLGAETIEIGEVHGSLPGP